MISDAAMDLHSGTATLRIAVVVPTTSTNSVGTKTTIVVSVPAVIARPTSVTPRSAASNGLRP